MNNLPSLYDIDLDGYGYEDDIQGEEYQVPDDLFQTKSRDISRAAELKEKELYRKSELQYEKDGSLIHDSNAMIRAKETANAGIRGIDWLLEASENIADFGQGDLIGYRDQFMAENEGKRYSMNNKDFITARATTTNELIDQYHTAQHDPNSDKGIYTLRKFDGYNADGTPKYIYKYGLADVSADTRYRDQYIKDGYDIVEEKRFAGAEDWEKTWNASQAVLDRRVLDSGSVVDDEGNMISRDVASGINFGDGKTELLSEDLLGVDDGKTDEDYARNKAVSQQLSNIADAKWQAGLDDSVIDAFQSGASKLAVDTGDFILDVLTPGDNTLLNDAKKQETIDQWVGYDRTSSTQTLSDAATYWKQGDYFKAITNVVSDPNTMVESIPMMIAFFTPIPGTRVAAATKIVKGIDEARKAGKSLQYITELERKLGATVGAKGFETYLKYKDTPKTMRALEEVAMKGNFHLGSMVLTNNVLDDRIEEKIAVGEEPDVNMAEVLGVYATQTLLLGLDRLSVEAIIGKGFGGELVKKTFGMADEAGKKQIVHKIVEKGFATVGAGSAEGMQEYLQTWGEILGANAFVGDKTISEVLNDEAKQNEALMGGLGGLGAGVQMNIGAQGIPFAITEGKKAYDYATMDAGEKVARKATTLDEYDVDEVRSSQMDPGILSSIVFNGTDKQTLKDFNVENTESFNKAIDIIMKKRLDIGALERAGITTDSDIRRHRGVIEQNMIQNALVLAHAEAQKEDGASTEPLNRVLALMQKLDKDTNSAFSIKEMNNSQNEGLMDNFMEIMQKNYESTGKDYDSLTAEEKNIAEENARNEALNDLKEKLKVAHVSQVINTQGSTIIENVDDINLDAKAGDSELTVGKIHELIEQYQSGGKDIKDVQDEFEKYGYIKEVDNKKGDKYVKIKPSLNKFQREITKQLINDRTKNTMLHSNVSSGVTLTSFANFAKSRLRKLKPSQNAKTGAIKDTKNTSYLLVSQEAENIKMKNLISEWIGLLNTTKIGNDNTALTQENKEKYIEFLEKLDAELTEANQIIESEKANIEAWAENELGVSNIDLDNKDHRMALAGVYATQTIDEDGNIVDGDVQVRLEDGQTYEERINYMKRRLHSTEGVEFETKAPKKKTKKTEPKQEKKTELEMEKEDVALLVNMMGISPVKGDSGSTSDALVTQGLILELIGKGADFQDAKVLKQIGETLTWLETEGKEFSEERKERATYKTIGKTPEEIAKNKAKYEKRSNGKPNQYLAIQLIEEIGEFVEESTANKEVSKLVELQKRVQKVIRFGVNTVIKDEKSPYNGKTNLDSLLGILKENKVEGLYSGDTLVDLLRLSYKLNKRINKALKVPELKPLKPLKGMRQAQKNAISTYNRLLNKSEKVILANFERRKKAANDLLPSMQHQDVADKFGFVAMDIQYIEKLMTMRGIEFESYSEFIEISDKEQLNNQINLMQYNLDNQSEYMNDRQKKELKAELNKAIANYDRLYGNKDTTPEVEPEVEPETTMQDEIKAIQEQYTTIEEASMQEALIFVGSIKKFFEKYNDISAKDKKEIGRAFDKMIRAVEASSRKDIGIVEDLYNEYKNLQEEKKVTSGIVPRMINAIKRLNTKMKQLAKRAEKHFEKMERENLLLRDLKQLANTLDGSEGNIEEMLNSTIDTQRDIARMSKFLKTQTKGKLEINFFGQALRTTEATYPAVKRFNDIVKKRLNKFKRNKGHFSSIFRDNRGSFMKETSTRYEAYKETTDNPMTFAEFMHSQGNQIEAEQKAQAEAYEEQLKYEQELANEDEIFTNKNLNLTDAGTILLTVKKPEVEIDVNDTEGFKNKKEYHITIVGFGLAKQISKLTEEQQSEIYSLINDANLSYDISNDIYKVKNDYKESRYTPKGGKEIVNKAHTREAIIVPVEINGLSQLMKDIQAVADLDIKEPYPHITLMVKGHKDGIGIPFKEDFDTLEKTNLNELVEEKPERNTLEEGLNKTDKEQIGGFETDSKISEVEAEQEVAQINEDIIDVMENIIKECE